MRGLVLAAVTIVVAAVLLLWLAQPDPTAPSTARDAGMVTKQIAPSLEAVDASVAEPTTTLTVHVVDVDGRPVPAIRVVVVGPGAGAEGRQLETDRDGVVETKLSPGMVNVFAHAYRGSVEQDVEITGAPLQTLELAFKKRSNQSVTVLVQDERGEPIADVPVHLEQFAASRKTNSRGRLTFGGLMEGSYRVSTRREAVPPRFKDGPAATIRTGTTGIITLQRKGTIEASVASLDMHSSQLIVEPIDEPVDYEEITLAPRSDRAFSASVPPGRYRVVARREQRFASAQASVRAGETTHVQLAAVDPATVHVTARRFPERTPMPGVSCGAGFITAITDEHGVALLRGVLPDTTSVSCSTTWDTEHRAGNTVIELRPGMTTTARVSLMTTESGGALGARVVLAADPSSYVFADVAPDGAAAKAGISDGDLLISVDGAPATGEWGATAATYLNSRPAGAKVNVGVRAKRGVYVINLTVTMGKL